MNLAKEWKPVENQYGRFLHHKKTGRLIIMSEGSSALDPDVIEMMTKVGGSIVPDETMRPTFHESCFGKDAEALKNAVVCTQLEEIKHGKDPIFLVADANQKTYLFKELVEGSEIYWQNWRFDKVCQEIGWTHLSPRVCWKEWNGKRGMLVEFFENAENVSKFEEAEIGSLNWYGKLDPTDVIRCALLDGLCVSRDRHSNNVMMDSKGRLALIDNTHAFKKEGHSRSIFVGTRPTKKTPDLYYKYYVVDGLIGTKFPPEYKAYLEKLSAMQLDQICLEFHFDDADRASALRFRAKDMLSSGFEHVCVPKE